MISAMIDDAPHIDQTTDLDPIEKRLVVDLVNVCEVLDLDEIEIAKIPDIRSYASGTGILRGKKIPLLDLGLRLESSYCDPATRLVVVKTEDYTMGFIVDAVSDILLRSDKQAETPNSLINYVAAVIAITLK